MQSNISKRIAIFWSMRRNLIPHFSLKMFIGFFTGVLNFIETPFTGIFLSGKIRFMPVTIFFARARPPKSFSVLH